MVTQPQRVQVLDDEIRITQNDDGVTTQDGTAAERSQIVEFTVPDRTRILIRAGDIFSLFASSVTPTEIDDSSLVEVVRSQAGGRLERIVVSTSYRTVKEFSDRNSLFTVGRDIELYPRDVLQIWVTAPTEAIEGDNVEFQISALQLTTVRL